MSVEQRRVKMLTLSDLRALISRCVAELYAQPQRVIGTEFVTGDYAERDQLNYLPVTKDELVELLVRRHRELHTWTDVYFDNIQIVVNDPEWTYKQK
jgi:hypothetical protein